MTPTTLRRNAQNGQFFSRSTKLENITKPHIYRAIWPIYEELRFMHLAPHHEHVTRRHEHPTQLVSLSMRRVRLTHHKLKIL